MFSVVSGETQEWWELFKKASVGISSLSGKISAETALIQSWFFCSENFQFQSCFRENPRCSALFQRKSALKQLWFSADFFSLKIWCLALFQSKSALFQRKSALKQLWFSADFFALKISSFRAVSEKISAVQLCFRENQRWNSSDSVLIFFLWKFGVSALFQSKSALFQRKSALKQLWFSADFFALKISSFRAVSEKISAVQLWISSVSELNQRCSEIFR